MENQSCREDYVTQLLNSQPDVDLQLLEAVKGLMMVNAIQYYEDNQSGQYFLMFIFVSK